MSEKRIQQLEHEVQQLKKQLKAKSNKYLDEVWLNSTQVKNYLNISDSKLYRLRKANLIPCTLVGKSYMYPKSYFTKTLLQKIKNREKME